MLFLYVVSLSICEPEDEDDVDEGADEDENIAMMMMMMMIMVMTMMTSIRRGHRPRRLGGYLKYPPPNPLPVMQVVGTMRFCVHFPPPPPPPARLRLILPHLSAFVFWTPSLFDVFWRFLGLQAQSWRQSTQRPNYSPNDTPARNFAWQRQSAAV